MTLHDKNDALTAEMMAIGAAAPMVSISAASASEELWTVMCRYP